MNNITAIVEYWTTHIVELTEKERAELEDYLTDRIPALMTAQIILDGKSRFAPGTALLTSALTGFDLQNMLVETRNSVYSLKGPGDIVRCKTPPNRSNYDYAVGETIARVKGLFKENKEKH